MKDIQLGESRHLCSVSDEWFCNQRQAVLGDLKINSTCLNWNVLTIHSMGKKLQNKFCLWFKSCGCSREKRQIMYKVNYFVLCGMGSKWHFLAATSTSNLEGRVYMQEGQCVGSRWHESKSWKWFSRQNSVNGLVCPPAAILRVDHSAVDLETIEALYENVRIIRTYGTTVNAIRPTQPRMTMTACHISLSASAARRAGEN